MTSYTSGHGVSQDYGITLEFNHILAILNVFSKVQIMKTSPLTHSTAYHNKSKYSTNITSL